MPQNHRQDATDRCLHVEGSRRSFPRQFVGGIPFLCMLLALVIVGATAAVAEESESQPPPRPTPVEMQEGLNAGNSAVYEAELTDPKAAEELPHQELNREQALDLMQAVFDPLLQQPAGIFDELDVEKFLSSNAAIVAPGDLPEASGPTIGAPPQDRYEGTTLLESTTPLRTNDGSGPSEVVDLGLEHSEGEVQSSNPLVKVGIPQQLGEGIELSESGIEVELDGAPSDRSPSTIDQSVAAYPEVAKDTSLAIAPMPGGFETLTLLQSANAPTSETFNLELPDGASLEPTQPGGALVTQGGQPLMGVAPPTATDAAGEEVPVSLAVSANALTLEVSPGPSTSWPVLVDPIYETYNWWNGITGLGGWSSWTNASPNYYTVSHATCTTYASPYSCQSGVTDNAPGLYIGALPGTVAVNSTANWEFPVPRWQEEWTANKRAPDSFITSMILEHVGFWHRTDSAPSPTLWTGIWNTSTPGWVGGYALSGSSPDLNGDGKFTFEAGQSTLGKIGTFNLSNTDGHSLSAFRDAFVSTAIVTIADTRSPEVVSTLGPQKWVNQAPSEPIKATFSDTGLGIYRLKVAPEGVSPPQWPTQTNSCTGTTVWPCPGKTTFNLTSHGGQGGEVRDYDPSAMPQGQDYVSLTAEDPLSNKITAKVEVDVDHTAPSAALSGTLTEQAKLGTSLPQYTLKYSAADGDAATPVAGTPFGTAGTGPGQMQEPKGIATDSSGNLWVVDRANERVMKYDSNGNFLMQFGSAGSGNGQFSDPRAIAIAQNGTIWVSDMGNNNVQAFNSSGQFIRKITGGDIPIPDPYGVATGPGGVLWISDITSDTLFEFSENGEFIRMVAIAGSANELKSPTGLATDLAGNVWLVDYLANRVQKYSSTGNFLMQFGSTGTGNGQLENPVAVAVAPSGNLLVTDSKSNRVQVFQPNGTYLRQFGSMGSGAGQFSTPVGIAMAAGNTTFVVDSGNHRVAKWTHADLDRQSGVVSTEVKVDGNLVEPKYAPGCSTENCSINNREWTLESSNYAAGQHTLEVVATDGVGLQTPKSLTFEVHPAPPSLALSGSMTEQATLGNTRPRYTLQAEAGPNGQSSESPPTFLSAFGTAGSGTGQLNGPRGVASDGKGHVWIVDRANNRVEQFNEAGEYLGQFGSAGSGNGQFNNPWGIAVTPAGNLWVADTENQRVEEFNSKGEFLQKFGTKASGSSKGTEFVLPEGIAVAPGGMIWVTDYSGNRIAEFRETVSSESERFVRNATGATIEQPRGVAVDGSGNVWVANVGSNQLLEFSPEGSFIRSAGSSGSGNGQLSNPGGLSIDSSGRIYLVDQNNSRVQIFNSKGEFLQKFGTAGTGNGNFSEPKAIALGAGGAIFVTDKGNNRVHKWQQALPLDPVASIEVKVDSKAVSTTSLGCASSNCTLAREWILKSAEYLGSHSVVVKATTAAGWSTTKTLTVQANPDATAPTLESGGTLMEAAKGWVEQKTYGLTATAKDTGYGVTSLAFKIDGAAGRLSEPSVRRRRVPRDARQIGQHDLLFGRCSRRRTDCDRWRRQNHQKSLDDQRRSERGHIGG